MGGKGSWKSRKVGTRSSTPEGGLISVKTLLFYSLPSYLSRGLSPGGENTKLRRGASVVIICIEAARL